MSIRPAPTRTEAALAASPHLALDLALRLPLGDALPLLELSLASPDPDLHLGDAVGEVHAHRDDREPLLLLHRREIAHLREKQDELRLALVPMRVYFTHGMAKVEIGLGKGKRQFEKRQSIAKRDAQREIEQAAGRRR